MWPITPKSALFAALTATRPTGRLAANQRPFQNSSLRMSRRDRVLRPKFAH